MERPRSCRNPDGSQYGMCTFPNGKRWTEEWALFNDHVANLYVQAATKPATIGMANPASVNCGNIGGTTQIMSNPDGNQYGMCTFPNGTTCEEWALYRNEGCKPNVYVAPATAATNASILPDKSLFCRFPAVSMNCEDAGNFLHPFGIIRARGMCMGQGCDLSFQRCARTSSDVLISCAPITVPQRCPP